MRLRAASTASGAAITDKKRTFAAGAIHSRSRLLQVNFPVTCRVQATTPECTSPDARPSAIARVTTAMAVGRIARERGISLIDAPWSSDCRPAAARAPRRPAQRQRASCPGIRSCEECAQPQARDVPGRHCDTGLQHHVGQRVKKPVPDFSWCVAATHVDRSLQPKATVQEWRTTPLNWRSVHAFRRFRRRRYSRDA